MFAEQQLRRGAVSFHGASLPYVGARTRPPTKSARYRALTRAAATPLSEPLKRARSQLEQDEQMRALIAGYRGSNLSEADFAVDDLNMQLLEVSSTDDLDQLPLVYLPDDIAAYWDKRPVAVASRIAQLISISGSFLSKVAFDVFTGKAKENEVQRAVELRNILTSLGPAYIKLGQALSIRPDLLSPAAMNELQKLCDKVPSFDSQLAMKMVEVELGQPWYEIFAELTPEPIAAASLGQVYKGKLKTGEIVAVKVQRPAVLQTVTIDLYIIRKLGFALRRFPNITTDVVALLDEWAARFFEELDYVKEGHNSMKFAQQMKDDLPQVVVPLTYMEYTSRRVLTTQWLEGEKLSQSRANDVGQLVNVGVICYLKQLLDTGFFHADPHPGNLIRTPDGRLAVLDFGLMTQVDDNIKFGMIEAISHLIHRDYEAIVKDFVTLDFIPEGTNLQPILPVLAKVFDTALEGGGAKNINFQELAADLAQITFDYPFRIPPYFALIIRAIGVLEGIALVGDPDFAIVDEAYPYLSKRLLTDDTPRLRAALKYMVYGRQGVFDADRLIDLLNAFELFAVSSQSARGDMDKAPSARAALPQPAGAVSRASPGMASPFQRLPFPLPPMGMPGQAGMLEGVPQPLLLPGLLSSLVGGSGVQLGAMNGVGAPYMAGGANSTVVGGESRAREALRFMLQPEGAVFREFIMDELVKSIDALSREQTTALVRRLGLQSAWLPVWLPGAAVSRLPLLPELSEEDQKVVENIAKLVSFLGAGNSANGRSAAAAMDSDLAAELLPLIPQLASEVLPELSSRLASRAAARLVRQLYLPGDARCTVA